MYKNSLFLIFTILLAHTVSIQASENKITHVTFINDEYEPEIIIALDNELRLLTKCSYGMFYVGQSVDITYDESERRRGYHFMAVRAKLFDKFSSNKSISANDDYLHKMPCVNFFIPF